MIKRTFFIVCLILLAGNIASAQQKSVTLRTYFPEPIAAYDRIQFNPGLSISGSCPIGTIAYQTIPSTDPAVKNLLYTCYDDNDPATDGGEWRILQDAWSHLLTLSASNVMDVFLTDNDNPNIGISIGTNEPELKLSLGQDGGILSIGDLGTDDILISPANDISGEFTGITHSQGTRLIWYPRKAAFRAGHLDNIAVHRAKWDDNNIGQYSIAMGHNTQSSAIASMVLSGENNVIASGNDYSTITGGHNNIIQSTAIYSTIAGGENNLISANDYSFIGGGQNHRMNGNYSYATILGGQSHNIGTTTHYTQSYSVIGGGSGHNNNITSGQYSTIIGGQQNTTAYSYAVVGGGKSNTTTASSGSYSTIIAGQQNTIAPAYSFIGGGGGVNSADGNSIPRIYSSVTSTYGGQNSVIGGGRNNINEQKSSTIVGGESNYLSFKPGSGGVIGAASRFSENSTIIGGRNNTATPGYVFIGGGENNHGRDNAATVIFAAAKIGGGQNNFSFKNGVIGGGYDNIIGEDHTIDRGNFSCIPGGESNRARHASSWVGGKNMELLSQHSFLWGNNPGSPTGASNRTHQFIVATGRVGIQTTSPTQKLDVNGHTIIRRAVSLKTPDTADDLSLPKTSVTIDSDGVVRWRQFDMTEIFAAAELLGPGDVVIMDNGNNGKLVKATHPYSTNAVGIVSTAPAMIFEGNRVIINPQKDEIATMHQADRAPIALKGRVPVKVTLENGPIEPGDPLTTSSVSGHAMKSTDWERSFGTTIGKAMEGFSGGPNGETEGVIITFVTLY
jgi:hypothetical protein